MAASLGPTPQALSMLCLLRCGHQVIFATENDEPHTHAEPAVPAEHAPLAVPTSPQVFFATKNDELRKPEPGMWEFFVANCNKGVVPGEQQGGAGSTPCTPSQPPH